MSSEPHFISTKTVAVHHLSGTNVGYHLPKPLVGSKPTLILIPSFASTATVFRPQIEEKTLLDVVNVLILEPLGHGSTKTKSPTYTLWDSALAFIQAMDTLGVKKAFVLGLNQGGHIAARMALYAPEKISGIIPVCSILDNSPRLQTELGCLDTSPHLLKVVTDLTATPNPNFAIPEESLAFLIELALGPDPSAADVSIWRTISVKSYTGNDGRLRLRQAAINLLTRDSLQLRIADIVCPVLWIAGSEDKVFTQQAAKQDLELFKSPVQLEIIPGAFHAPTWTHPVQVSALVIDFIKKHGGKVDARALREAVGMVDI